MALNDAVEKALCAAVGEDHVRTDPDSLRRYGRDTCDLYAPSPSAIVFPAGTEAVQAIVRLANEHRLALVPSGGRTGLSGGATAINGEIVVSLERMNRILESSVTDCTVNCQAGVATARLQQQAEEMGLYYPVDFASTGSSHVGGNIATNAGGNRVIRYGMTRNWVAGLQVVTGVGEVLELGRGLMKDNTGYDLTQLFIASEGTLGIITQATMRLTRAPEDSAVMVLGLDRIENLIPTLDAFRAVVTVNAFEFFTEQALARVIERHDHQRPFDRETEVYALVEFENRGEADARAALGAFEHCNEDGWVLDGTMSQSHAQAAALWRLREDISETLSRWSPYKNDLSVRVSNIPAFLEEVGRVVAERYPDFEVLWYGHIGDGNVHLNVLKPENLEIEEFRERCSGVSEVIYQVIERFGGSVSAEHGVGLLKKPYLGYTRTREEVVLMKTIKSALDPNGVMNPGKVFD